MEAEDQSHYEISLTAGQAFVAFVLLLLSLAASFAFGLMISRAQPGPSPITEAAAVMQKRQPPPPAKAEISVKEDDFKAPAATIESSAPPPALVRPGAAATTLAQPTFAQLLSTTDQKSAEALAAKLIERGFTAAYVERTTSEKGPTFRVRVKFPNEGEAHAAEAKLKEFSKEVWITR
jgi:sporulation related protein